MSSAAGSVRLPERYVVVRHIADGGMASVWEARDDRLGRPVAVKVLSDALSADDAARGRFTREALAAARLSSHPHVVTVFDAGEQDGHAFLVMALYSGGTVGDRLKAAGSIDRRRALRWLRGTALALDAAHAEGVVHRDVKPGNLLLDDHDEVAVGDFGIATAAWAASVTQTGLVVGTMAYLSPEQIGGQPATPASDRYALGVVAHELLTGRRPQDGGLDPALPAAAVAALRDAIDADPARRPASCAELVDRLQDALAPVPVPEVAPPARTARTARPPRAEVPTRATVAAPRPPGPHAPDRARGSSPARKRGVAVAAVVALVLLAGAAIAVVTGGGGGGRTGASDAARTTTTDRRARSRTPSGASGTTAAAGAGAGGSAGAAGGAAANAGGADPSATPGGATPGAGGAAAGAGGAASNPDAGAVAPVPAGTPSVAAAAALNDQGLGLLRAGRPADAVPVLRSAVAGLARAPTDLRYAYALFNLGHALRLSGQPAEAVIVLERRLAVNAADQPGAVQAELSAARAAAGQGPAPEGKGKGKAKKAKG